MSRFPVPAVSLKAVKWNLRSSVDTLKMLCNQIYSTRSQLTLNWNISSVFQVFLNSMSLKQLVKMFFAI